MSATGKTENYNLPLIQNSDNPQWGVDFNGAMTIIDGQMKDNADKVPDLTEVNKQISDLSNGLESTNEQVASIDNRIGNIESGSNLGGIRYDETNNQVEINVNGTWVPWKEGYSTIEIGTNYIYQAIGTNRFKTPVTGSYKIEAYGAQGGGMDTANGGYGGYSYGTINLTKGQFLYLTIGGRGVYADGGGFGGGGFGKNGGAGGGGSFVLLVDEPYDTVKPQNILVAAGGGGGGLPSKSGGTGGGLEGGSGYGNSKGGTQTGGYSRGKGQSYENEVSTSYYGGGGGGYYGGFGVANGAGAGGSGYLNENLSDAKTTNGVNAGSGRIIITYLGG